MTLVHHKFPNVILSTGHHVLHLWFVYICLIYYSQIAYKPLDQVRYLPQYPLYAHTLNKPLSILGTELTQRPLNANTTTV